MGGIEKFQVCAFGPDEEKRVEIQFFQMYACDIRIASCQVKLDDAELTNTRIS